MKILGSFLAGNNCNILGEHGIQSPEEILAGNGAVCHKGKAELICVNSRVRP